MTNVLFALGRVALVAIFLWSGYGKLMNPGGAATAIASKGLPLPKVLAYVTIAAELALAALVVIGWQARLAALALAVFTAATIFFFHDFWHYTGEAARMQTIHALKNVSIIGGLLMLAATGPGRFAVGR
jgi:putative oxidoreductase